MPRFGFDPEESIQRVFCLPTTVAVLYAPFQYTSPLKFSLVFRHLELMGLVLFRRPEPRVRIPVNVTADSGNVTGIPANVTEGRCCAF